MKKLFLYKVYQYNKKLFFFFLIFAGITIFCNLTGFEITPFYVWGMYSEKEVAPKEYPILKITSNGHLVDYSTGYFPANRFFLLSPLLYYTSIKGDEDPTKIFLQKKLNEKYDLIQPFAEKVLNSQKEIQQFPIWYKSYIEQTTGKKSNHLKVELLSASYKSDNAIMINSVHTIIDEK